MTKSRIPLGLKAFDVYLRRVAPFLRTLVGTITNGERLGLTPAEVTQSTAYHDQWYTGTPSAPGAYEAHSNPDTKTKTTRNTVVTIVKNYTKFMNPLLTRMGTSPVITESDRSILNIPVRDTTSTARGTITETPVVNINSFAGGRMGMRTRTSTDASRASMHKLADGIEVRFQVGGTQPASAVDCANYVISSKALFNIETGINNGEKKFYCFARYVNFVKPGNNGPWGSLNTGSVQS
jgi:hypothetical protein